MPSLSESIRLSACLSLSPPRFLSTRPLKYWVEIWFVNLSWRNTNQVQISARLTSFYHFFFENFSFLCGLLTRGVTSITKVYTDVRLEWGILFRPPSIWMGIIFTSKVYQWGIFFTQKVYEWVKFEKKSIWMGSIFKNSIWMGSIFDMGSIWMGHVFHLAWYMNGVGFGDSSRTSVPKIMASDPPVSFEILTLILSSICLYIIQVKFDFCRV